VYQIEKLGKNIQKELGLKLVREVLFRFSEYAQK
jgi:hypothetical protein